MRWPVYDARMRDQASKRWKPIASLSLLLLVLLSPIGFERLARAEIASPQPRRTATLEPEQSSFGASACTATPAREVGRSSVRNVRLAIASQPALPGADASPGTTLVAWSAGEHAFATRSISAADVLGTAQTVAIDQGMGLEVLAPASSGRFIAVVVGQLCAGRARGHSCLRATGLAPDGSGLSTPYAPEPDSQMLSVRSRTTLRGSDLAPTGVAIVSGARYGAAITLFRLDVAGRVLADVHPLDTSEPEEVPIHALFSDGEQVVALGSEWSAQRDSSRPFVLALGQRRQYMAPAVPESARFSTGRLGGAELDLYYGMPRGRVRRLRVSTTDGSYAGGGPTTLGATDELPISPVFPTLAVSRRALTLTRTDLRGARVGTPVTLAPAAGRPVIASTWDGLGLRVAWATRVGREWVISESRVTCSM